MRGRLIAIALAVAAVFLAASGQAAAAITVRPLLATEGAGLPASTTVATFTDAGPLCLPASAYTAAIDWGDGSPVVTGTITGASVVAPCAYTVSAGHTYAEEGGRAVTVTVVGGTAAGRASAAAAVGDAALTAGGATTVTGIAAGTPFSSQLGVFGDANLGATADEFTATVNWGDGTAPTGAMVATGAGPGTFVVRGGHTYAASGAFPIAIFVRDAGGSSTLLTGVARVGAGPGGGGAGGGGGGGGGVTPPATTFKLGLSGVAVVRGAIITARLSCPATESTCRGRATAFVPRGNSAIELASSLFVIPGGLVAKLDLRPTKGALAGVAGVRRVTVAATALDPTNGRSGAAQATARLRLARMARAHVRHGGR